MGFAGTAQAGPIIRNPAPLPTHPVGVRPGVIFPRGTFTPGIHLLPRSRKPDLIPVVSNPFNGVITVKNIGNATAGASKVVIACKNTGHFAGHFGPRVPRNCENTPAHIRNYYDVSLGGMAFSIRALRPGQSQRINIPDWRFVPHHLPTPGRPGASTPTPHWRPGTYNFTVVADGGGVVAESNERNNRVSTSMTVHMPQPDLIPVIAGSLPHLMLGIVNGGRATAGASWLEVRCRKVAGSGGCPDALNPLRSRVPSLSAGQRYRTFIPTGLSWSAGEYEFTATADVTGAVVESRENNNVKRAMVRQR
jgi:hypothetical protein